MGLLQSATRQDLTNMFKISGRQKSLMSYALSLEPYFNCIAFFQHTEVSESLGT